MAVNMRLCRQPSDPPTDKSCLGSLANVYYGLEFSKLNGDYYFVKLLLLQNNNNNKLYI